MKIKSRSNLLVFASIVLAMALSPETPLVFAAQSTNKPATKEPATNKPSTAGPSRVKFRPKTTQAPSVRGTGGSRGTGDSAIALSVLAPEQVGLTTQEQPSLFWYQSRPSEAKFELTVLEDNKSTPLLHVKLDHAANAGIQRIKLSDKGVKLAPGVEYEWVVALVTDSTNRSSDLVSNGVIKRIEPDASLKNRIAGATPENRAAVFAEEGIWYDALAALSDQIERQPQNLELRDARADLLAQVGLDAAARADRAQ